MTLPATYLKMTSTIAADGVLSLALVEKAMPSPKPDQVIVQIEATPINPSDLGVMFGATDMTTATSSGSGKDRILTAAVSDMGMRVMKGRIDQALDLGNEGAGLVVAAGDSAAAQGLIGKRVAVMGGAMYAQYRCLPAASCMPLPDDATAKDGASSFVNPLTALGFLETMKMEGHKAIVHTAAASNLGLMLNRICQADGVDIVNIVRRKEQADILTSMGAKYVLDSSATDFMPRLVDAVHETGATLGFDATGGGKLASDILTAMEGAAARTPGAYSIYGSIAHKQVYIYGGLDMAPTTLTRGYGMAWGVGGWLLPNFLAKAGQDVALRLQMRVAKELKTTFASRYTGELSMADALKAENVAKYNAKTTGEKFLICPQQGL